MEALKEHPNPSFSDHARVGERVRGPPHVDAHTSMRADSQRCDAGKNGFRVDYRGFFCHLANPLRPRDRASPILAGHARLGERLHEHRLHAENARPQPRKFGTATPAASADSVSWRKKNVIFGYRIHEFVWKP